MDQVFSSGDGHMDNDDAVADNSVPSATCILCERIFSSSNEVTPDLETVDFCGDCEFLYLEDLGNSGRNSPHRQSDRRRTRTRPSSSESIENRWWRSVLSDTESDDYDQIELDSIETGSNVSFGQNRFVHVNSDAVSYSVYGGESEASVDGHGFLDAETSIQPYYRSDFDIDNDIDPMRAGLNQWNSDDQEGEEEEEEDVEWEEPESEEEATAPRIARAQLRNYITSPSESGYSIPWNLSFDSHVFDRVIHPRIRGSRRVADMDFPHIVGNPGDYLDERAFEEFLEQLAENDNSRQGTLPAAESFLENMPTIIVDKEHLKINDGLACAICKDVLTVGVEVNQLPCFHLYHPQCISSWLKLRNSCPLCRYELPTDDKDCEGKQESSNGIDMLRTNNMESSEDSSDENDSETETDGSVEMNPATTELGRPDGGRNGGGGRWLFLAPVISLIGLAATVWFSNTHGRELTGPNNLHQIQNQRGRRGRRWYSFL